MGAGKRGGDIGGTGDVEGEEKELGGRVELGERGEHGGFAEGGNDDVALAEDDFGEGFPEPGGCARDCRGWCRVSVSEYFDVLGTH